MANLQSTTITGGITEKEGTGATAEATVALPQKGSTVVFESTNTVTFASSAYDISTNKYVIAYRDDTDAGKGKAVVGTPSGDSIVWGTPVQFSTGETTATTGGNVAAMGFCMAYDPDTERIVIAWSEGDISGTAVPSGAGNGTSKVGTVSGTGSGGTITFGSEGTFDTGGAVIASYGGSNDGTRFCQCMVYDTTNNKMLIAWMKANVGDFGQIAVGTIVGGGTNSITWGTPVRPNTTASGEWNYVSLGFDPSSGNILVAWEDHVASAKVSYIRVGTVSTSPDTVTFGTVIGHMAQDADDTAMSYDPVAQKIILAYTDYGAALGGNYGVARVITVSGTGTSATCHLGYPVRYSDQPDRTRQADLVYNTSTQRHLIHWTYYYPSSAANYQALMVKSAKVTGVTLSCTRTNASTTVTTADTSSLAVGMSVSGTGMGVGALYTEVTTIIDITSSTTFVLSAAASAGGTSSLTFTSISFSGPTTVETSGYVSNQNLQIKMAYNSADNKMLVPRHSPNPSGTIIDFNGTGLTVDLATGSFFEVDLENATEVVAGLTVSNPHASHVSTFILQITQGSTARVINWDLVEGISHVKWPGGTAPTLTTTNDKVDSFSFTTWDNGTSWYGKIIGQNFG